MSIFEVVKAEVKKIDVINRILEDCILAYPVSSFIIGIYQQYQRRGWLTKKQLQGLHEKAARINGMAPEKLAAVEAIIKKMPDRHKSDLPEAKPLYQKDESTGETIDIILAKYPQHKRVLFLRSKYDNNEPLSPAEITELARFKNILKV
jgi:D-alanyl-D-alanine dipeptidase